MSKPICRHCVAEKQLFKRCRNLSAGTVLQRCSCLCSVAIYLPALCCRSAAVKAVSQPTCWQCVAGVQLFKQFLNLSAGMVLQGCSYLSGVETYLPGTVLQRCSCLSSVATYLPALCCSCLGDVGTYLAALCCRGAGCLSSVGTYLPGTVLQGCRLFKRCQNLPLRALWCRLFIWGLSPPPWHCRAGVQVV